jgi:hypothetical protein
VKHLKKRYNLPVRLHTAIDLKILKARPLTARPISISIIFYNYGCD